MPYHLIDGPTVSIVAKLRLSFYIPDVAICAWRCPGVTTVLRSELRGIIIIATIGNTAQAKSVWEHQFLKRVPNVLGYDISFCSALANPDKRQGE